MVDKPNEQGDGGWAVETAQSKAAGIMYALAEEHACFSINMHGC
jgi:hypothetical protein